MPQEWGQNGVQNKTPSKSNANTFGITGDAQLKLNTKGTLPLETTFGAFQQKDFFEKPLAPIFIKLTSLFKMSQNAR